jgi:hypothetical protein
MDPSSVDEQLPPFRLDEFEERSVWKGMAPRPVWRDAAAGER